MKIHHQKQHSLWNRDSNIEWMVDCARTLPDVVESWLRPWFDAPGENPQRSWAIIARWASWWILQQVDFQENTNQNQKPKIKILTGSQDKKDKHNKLPKRQLVSPTHICSHLTPPDPAEGTRPVHMIPLSL